jgi:integrase
VVGHLLPLQPGKTIQTQHHPAMPWPVVPAFVTTQLHSPHGFKVTRQALMFLILTASRSGEVRFMSWDEVEQKAAVWTLPAERMKAKQIHRVPYWLSSSNNEACTTRGSFRRCEIVPRYQT